MTGITALSSYLSIRHKETQKLLDGEHVNRWLHCHVEQNSVGSFNHFIWGSFESWYLQVFSLVAVLFLQWDSLISCLGATSLASSILGMKREGNHLVSRFFTLLIFFPMATISLLYKANPLQLSQINARVSHSSVFVFAFYLNYLSKQPHLYFIFQLTSLRNLYFSPDS